MPRGVEVEGEHPGAVEVQQRLQPRSEPTAPARDGSSSASSGAAISNRPNEGICERRCHSSRLGRTASGLPWWVMMEGSPSRAWSITADNVASKLDLLHDMPPRNDCGHRYAHRDPGLSSSTVRGCWSIRGSPCRFAWWIKLFPQTTNQGTPMTVGRYPSTRLRRNRHDGFTRRLVAENNLSVDDLIWPIFVTDGHDTETEVSSMPGVKRVTLDRLAAHVAPAARLGIPAIALFPMTPLELRDDEGTESGNPDNLICRSARLLKAEFPEIGLIGDVALDPYTSHGHDGVLRETPSHPHYVANDASVAVLVRQALNQAQSGIDILAPSDMMDGRIGAIRTALDTEDLVHTG